MKCGVAGAEITPQPGPVLQGHWSTNPSKSVLYPLEIRAIAFEHDGTRTAIVTVDVIGVTKATTDQIRAGVEREHGIVGDHLTVACSHTHCAPGTLPCLGMTPAEDWLKRIVDTAVACVGEALQNIQPVQLAVGCGSVHFNISRRPLPGTASMMLNFGGLVDRRARVLRVEAEDGSALAVLFHYSCHPTTKSGSEGDISPDYPGIARRVVEESIGCKALFLAGCFGNVRPAILHPETGGFTSATKEQLDACGEELGREVARVAESLKAQPATRLAARRTDVDIKFGDLMPTDELQKMADDPSDRGRLLTGPWAKHVLEMVASGTVPKVRPTEMQVMAVGPLTLVTIPGEPVQEIGHAIEKSLKGTLDVDDVWPVGYANDEIGYLCTDRHYGEGGYEPNAYPYYGEPARFLNEEDTIVKTAEELAEA
jgi:neutral ceramidase